MNTKKNSEDKNFGEVIKENLVFKFVKNQKLLLCNGLEKKILFEKEKIKHGNCSCMYNGACCDLKSNGDLLKLHDICPNPEYRCRKQITFTPRQFQLEGAGFENTKKSTF